MVWEELQQALEELPDNQREVFIETAINGRSIKELSQRTGVLEKTLLSRKHYAVTYLRRRLANLYEELLT